MYFEPDQLYHVYNRGNNRQQLFFMPDHYLHFLRKVRRHILPHCELLAYCLMPNHFHLLLYTTQNGCRLTDTPSSNRQLLTRGIAVVLSSYTQGLNKQLNRTGALFQAKTKAILLPDTSGDYPRTCFHYIHQNPVRAKLAASLEQWPYSSYRDYAGLRNGTLCNQPVAHQLLDIPSTPELFQLESAQAIPVGYVAGWL